MIGTDEDSKKKDFWDSKWVAAIVYALMILGLIGACTGTGHRFDPRDGDDPCYD